VAGKEVRYVAAYTWCSRFRPGPGDTFLLEDVRVLFNRKPRSAEDLENLVVVDQERSARELGDVLSDLMGRASGLRARKAVFHGSKDVLDARKIVLEGGVEVCIAAAGAHDGPTILHVPELVIVFEEGVATSARGKGPVLIESPQGRIEGKGLLIERDGRRLEIEHAVRATLLAGESEDEPRMTVTADGPLLVTVTEGDLDIFDFQGTTRVDLEGNVRVEVPAEELVLTGDHASADLESGGGLKRAEIRGRALVDGPLGTLSGNRIVFRPLEDGRQRIEVGGGDVAYRGNGPLGLPGGGAGRGFLVRTKGLIALEFEAESFGKEPLDVTVGPLVDVTAGDWRVSSRTMEVRLEPDERRPAPSGPKALRLRPSGVLLAGEVKGRAPDGDLRCDTLTWQRMPARDRQPSLERLLLEGSSSIELLMSGRSRSPASRSNGIEDLLDRPGRLAVRAERSIEVLRDPLEMQALRITAVQDVVALRHERGRPADPLASFRAQRMEMEVAPSWSLPRTGEVAEEGFRRTWRLERAEAWDSIAFRLENGIEGFGSHLLYDGRERVLTLEETTRPNRARLVLREKGGGRRTLFAPRVRFHPRERHLVADGDVEIRLKMPPLHLGPLVGDQEEVVETSIYALTLEGTLAAGAIEGEPDVLFEHLTAEVGVRLQQPRAQAHCAFLQADLMAGHLVARGDPARLEILNHAGRPREYLRARSIIGTWPVSSERNQPPIGVRPRELLLEEPVKVRIMARQRNLLVEPGSKRARGREAPLAAIEIETEGNVYMTRDRVISQGATRIAQGDPEDEGFLLRANRVALFLIGSPERREGVDFDIFRAVARGNVRFLSRDLQAEAREMLFDAREEIITLRGDERPVFLVFKGQRFPDFGAYAIDLRSGVVQDLPDEKKTEGRSMGNARR